MGLERRDRAVHGQREVNPVGVDRTGEEPRVRPETKVKSCEIDKRLVYGAWEKVRANPGRGVGSCGPALPPLVTRGSGLRAGSGPPTAVSSSPRTGPTSSAAELVTVNDDLIRAVADFARRWFGEVLTLHRRAMTSLCSIYPPRPSADT